jgi:hypothetical protein
MANDKDLADRLGQELAKGRRELERRMGEHGLAMHAGWRIHEELINTPEGTAFVLRPVHRVEVSPDALEVRIDLRLSAGGGT